MRTDFVLHNNRMFFDRYMREKTIDETFSLPLDSNSEDNYESACLAISQFLIQSPQVQNGFAKMFAQYNSLQYSTKRAFLEAVYATYPQEYKKEFQQLIVKETEPKLFAMQALYLFKNDGSKNNLKFIQTQMQQSFPQNDTLILLGELKKYLVNTNTYKKQSAPNIISLFNHQKNLHQKIIYSFQRWNRDFPGIAIIQNADGNFAKDSFGKLLTFQQLARSASNLPYFITNGNTPQGIFSITGVQIDHNNFIGPTPTIQLVMPFEEDSIYWQTPYDSTKDALTNYLDLLPDNWKKYQPITEAFFAGKIGRTEIISHGTTLDPDYFKGKPYYPISPTLGCLCAKETWNIFTGKLLQSEQLNLVNTFLSTPNDTGYLFVINIDDEQKPVAAMEAEELVKQFESNK
ncbi:MAG: hypothetical protein ACR2FN_15080 [Chitinophagaceae bacterium]